MVAVVLLLLLFHLHRIVDVGCEVCCKSVTLSSNHLKLFTFFSSSSSFRREGGEKLFLPLFDVAEQMKMCKSFKKTITNITKVCTSSNEQAIQCETAVESAAAATGSIETIHLWFLVK